LAKKNSCVAQNVCVPFFGARRFGLLQCGGLLLFLGKMGTHFSYWIAFNAAVLVLLAIDLFGLHRRAHEFGVREAALRCLAWVGLSMAFCALVWHWKGPQKGVEFLTGYLVEYSLSVDNIFVFVLIFSHFKVPPEQRHRVLFFGIIGAFVMRGTMILLGMELVAKFHWTLYLFGAFLLATGVQMFFKEDADVDLEHSPVLRFLWKWMRVTPRHHGAKFTIRENGALLFTPLAMALVAVELMDLLFALDSIPAVFAITQDPFIVYTSNICAILGLRAMYFLFAKVVTQLVFLHYGIAAVLSFIGAKMLLAHFFTLSAPVSLGVVVLLLAIAVVASLLAPKK
jgi:tellurite resistance protein TerC